MKPGKSKREPRRVLIIYTGGTFGMRSSRIGRNALEISKLSSADLKKDLIQHVPELKHLAQCKTEVAFNRDSAHLGPKDWISLAGKIRKKWKNFDGFVILHGTDTLAYTACALSFLLRPCKKPVILTGAQKPLASLRSDARRNLISAVEIAAGDSKAINQVMIFFNDRLLQGNRTRKQSASDFDAFDSPMAPPIATVGTSIRWSDRSAPRTVKSDSMVAEFSGKIAMMHVTPGFPAATVAGMLDQLAALVLIVFPSGTAPTQDPPFISMLREAKRRKIPVILTAEGSAETPGSPIHPSTYAAGRELLREGCYWAGEMTPECAYVKTAWILAQPQAFQRFKKLWSHPFAQEGRSE